MKKQKKRFEKNKIKEIQTIKRNTTFRKCVYYRNGYCSFYSGDWSDKYKCNLNTPYCNKDWEDVEKRDSNCKE